MRRFVHHLMSIKICFALSKIGRIDVEEGLRSVVFFNELNRILAFKNNTADSFRYYVQMPFSFLEDGHHGTFLLRHSSLSFERARMRPCRIGPLETSPSQFDYIFGFRIVDDPR